MSMREAGNVKRRRVVGAKKRTDPGDKLSLPSGATGEHYLQFINDIMDIMDEFLEMKGCSIVMDNASIHMPDMIDPVVLNRGYVPVHLPPCSPELNLIEKFWSILKGKVKRTMLKDVETLTTRIIEASEAVPVEHIRNTIRHSANQFDKCRNKVAI